jgi:hypothetical protein
MLALIAIMITLIIGRWLNFRGVLHKWAMPLMILGTIVLNLGVWGVVTPLEPAYDRLHGSNPIHAGSPAGHLAGTIHPQGTKDIAKPNAWQKLKALVRDPLKFGALWQMVFMNFTVSGIGIFMAVKLDEIFRLWPAREERIELTGHWHILSAIIATIILLYYGDMMDSRQSSPVSIGSLSFPILPLLRTIFEMKRLFTVRLGSSLVTP